MPTPSFLAHIFFFPLSPPPPLPISPSPPLPTPPLPTSHLPHPFPYQIDSIVHGRRSEVSFNTSWLEDLYEEIVAEITGEKVTPLVSNPGRIMLTSSRLYFQPFNNVEVVRDRT